MRIIAGSLGGRVFDSPGTRRTHPMSDRVRGALFNVLGDLEGLTVLDAFAGSGALGIEAVSRGAHYSMCIENDRLAQQTITRNIQSLALKDCVKLIKATANAWLRTNQGAKFDIVLCDPPYDNLQPALIIQLADHAKVSGLVVLSLPPKATVTFPPGQFELLTTKAYGDAQLVFYRRIR